MSLCIHSSNYPRTLACRTRTHALQLARRSQSSRAAAAEFWERAGVDDEDVAVGVSTGGVDGAQESGKWGHLEFGNLALLVRGPLVGALADCDMSFLSTRTLSSPI